MKEKFVLMDAEYEKEDLRASLDFIFCQSHILLQNEKAARLVGSYPPCEFTKQLSFHSL